MWICINELILYSREETILLYKVIIKMPFSIHHTAAILTITNAVTTNFIIIGYSLSCSGKIV